MSRGIQVAGDDVDYIVAGIVFDFRGILYPDEVVKAVAFREALEHQAVELFARLRAFASPPEPAALGLVEGSP